MSRRGRGGIRGSRQLLVGSRRRRVRLGTRSRRSRFYRVPDWAMEQVKKEGQAEAQGPLRDRSRPGRGWRGRAGTRWGRRAGPEEQRERRGREGRGRRAVSGGARPGRGERRVHSVSVASRLGEESRGETTVRRESGPPRQEGPAAGSRRPPGKWLWAKRGVGG